MIIKPDSDNETLNILINELIHNLETYYFLDDILRIPKVAQEIMTKSFSMIESSYPSLISYYESIAKNVIKKIKQLGNHEEYTIPTGWYGHAVCLSFRRINQTHINIRVDNSSPLNPKDKHVILFLAANPIKIKPRVLGYLHINDIQNNLKYFILLIDSVRRDLSLQEGVELIYNQKNIIQGLKPESIEHVFPFFDVQAQANCFVKCYEPGSSIRFGEKYEQLYNELVLCQKNNATLLVTRCEKEYGRDCRTLIDQFIILAKEPVPNSIIDLLDRLKSSYLQNHQYMLRNTIGESDTQLTQSYIPLRFENK